jgi:hypothetical protein
MHSVKSADRLIKKTIRRSAIGDRYLIYIGLALNLVLLLDSSRRGLMMIHSDRSEFISELLSIDASRLQY